MFALRFASLFLLTSTSLVAASPVAAPAPVAAVDKRANADIAGVLDTLTTTVGTILPQIDSLVSSGTATDATVTPLVNDLTGAFDTATAALAALPASRKRQSDDDIAKTVAALLTDVANTLDGLLGTAATVPTLGVLLGGIDTSLAQVLRGLETLLAGVLNLVANLLTNVAALLRNLALGLTLAALGL